MEIDGEVDRSLEVELSKKIIIIKNIYIYIYVLWGEKKNQEINCGREKEKFKTYVSGDRGGS
jgi:hypothetical protein